MNAEVPDWVELTADEEVVWTSHPSPYVLAGSAVFAVVLVVAGSAVLMLVPFPLAWAGLALVLAGVLLVVAGYVRLRSVQYVLTTEEVYKKTGVLSRQVTNLRLDRIQNTGFEQTALQRLLSYGDVRVETAGTGGTDIVLRAVPDPQRVNGILTERLDQVTS